MAKILVGNKVDLAEYRAVNKEQAELLALNHNLHYYETSAKQNINISECMEDIFEQSIQQKFSLGASQMSQQNS